MSSALITSLLTNPQVRKIARNMAVGTIKTLGKSRRRRANKKQWYFGKRVGIPPNLAPQRKPMPIATSSGQRTSTPASATISAEEVICSLQVTAAGGPTLFGADTYSLNVAEPTTFPRASQAAMLYQKYRITSLRISYVSRLPTTTTGMVALALMADPTSETPGSMSDVAALAGAVLTSAYSSVDVPLPTALQAALGKNYLVKRMATPNADADSPLNSAARLVVASEGIANQTILGQLLVRYTIVFSDPKTNPDGATCTAFYRDCPILADVVSFEDPDVAGSQPFWARDIADPTLVTKRTSHPLLLYLETFSVTVEGAEINTADHTYAPRHFSEGTTKSVAVFWLPAGRYDFSLNLINPSGVGGTVLVYATTLGVTAGVL